MSNPTAAAVTPTFVKSAGDNGAIRESWVAMKGFVGAADCDSESVTNYVESPFSYDVYIMEALMVIHTADAQDADFDIGIADDATATNAEDNIFDSPVNTGTGALKGLAGAAAGTSSLPRWKAADSSTNSYITVQQNGDVDASSLDFDLFVKVIPCVDVDE